MIFTETKLQGAFIIGIRKIEDERGFFGRSWCKKEMEEHGLSKCSNFCETFTGDVSIINCSEWEKLYGSLFNTGSPVKKYMHNKKM